MESAKTFLGEEDKEWKNLGLDARTYVNRQRIPALFAFSLNMNVNSSLELFLICYCGNRRKRKEKGRGREGKIDR